VAPGLILEWNSGVTDEPLNLSFDALHDADAGVWVANSADGRITTEAPSRDALIERLKLIAPDVVESRLGHPPRSVSITINWQELRTFERTELMIA
jgi:hypothetical protein